MARYTGSVCRQCRRENMKLFLKGDRCHTAKCAFDRRSYIPGEHGDRRGRKVSDYGIQLREKQKVKRMYGLSEKQFRMTYDKARYLKGIHGVNLLVSLEIRLDNVVYRLGFATSRAQARQLVRHGHFLINGKKVDIPSCALKAGDVVELKEKSRNMTVAQESVSAVERVGLPQWLELDKTAMKGTVKALPLREDLTMPIQEQLIVELYSK